MYFGRLKTRVEHLENILQEQETEEKLISEYHKIRLNLREAKSELASKIILTSGPVRYLDDNILIVNGIAIKGLDKARIPYRKIE